jgi:hypothetical protein
VCHRSLRGAGVSALRPTGPGQAAATATLTEPMFARGNESVRLDYGEGWRWVYERVGFRPARRRDSVSIPD